MKLALGSVGVAALCALSGSAEAGVYGVNQIVISSAIPTYLQVAEVVAFDPTSTNISAAINGAIATATSDYSPPPDGGPGAAIDGDTQGDYFTAPSIYHSLTDAGTEKLTITLASPSEIDYLTIYGRTDNGGFTRDYYIVTLLDAFGGTLYSAALDPTSPNLDDTYSTTTGVLADVPEPASSSLLVAGVLGLMGLRRRSR